MPRISVLPEHIASQIAAGEVVERPSSAVKELVENAIDAGAARIVVDISEGCRHIRVADNGCGMETDDATLAFQRHATSKLASADDLWNIGTLGFRGEALPSIAAVCHLTCYTRTENHEIGTKVACAEGSITVCETGCATGTIIEVADLFYNVPARLKFLKKPATEFAYIHEIIQSLAITYPQIAFQLSLDGKTKLSTTGSGDLDPALRESNFFGSAIFNTEREKSGYFSSDRSPGSENFISGHNLIPLEARDGVLGLSLEGRLASALSFRGDRKGILTIVNGRPVRCPLTYKAIDYAYADLIPRGRYPMAVVHLKVNPADIDINIHPTKKEIRYSKGNEVYLFLQRQIAHALRMSRNIHADTNPDAKLDFSPSTETTSFSYAPENSQQLSLKEAASKGEYNPFFKGAGQSSERRTQMDTALADPSLTSFNSKEQAFNPSKASLDRIPLDKALIDRASLASGNILPEPSSTFISGSGMHSLTKDLGLSSQHTALSPADSAPFSILPIGFPVSSASGFTSASSSVLPVDWRIAGYIGNTYILIETKSGLSIIEQHIAHERVLYERLLARANKLAPLNKPAESETEARSKTEARPKAELDTEAKSEAELETESQTLIISLPLNLTEEQKSVLQENTAELTKQGFEFEIDGTNISCSQVPLELAHKDYAKIIQTILQELAESSNANPKLEIIKSIACQSAIKNGMPLAPSQIIELLNLWYIAPRNQTCPHGRPIQLNFSYEKLFQLFHPT